MKAILFGAAVGYVLGARAGRRRYEQIVRLYRAVADHPAVRGATDAVRAKVGEKTGFGRPPRRESFTVPDSNGRPDPVIPRTN
ncbi:hypothetical protein GCM10022243_23930 [Saccharothrix violaceirubra]|uniref:Uncharacterized protein n=1 Tax=Saccharothrix violaceirubra TaxID=413306 RepID=A0A7W7T762_9PSEU|nr:hypothetical protein [Saccharothrix violaceirubra]MBB4967838.1 hypothetical protein [Saccharothrix violaceirubra]